MVTICGQIVIFPQIGRVTFSTHRIPILGHAGPMHGIIGVNGFVRCIGWRNKEPLLTADAPRDTQHLHAAVVKLDHVLL